MKKLLFAMLIAINATVFAGFQDISASVGLDAYAPAGEDVSAAWGDVNNDGWVDIYIGTYSNDEGGLFLNNAGTSFTEVNVGVSNLPGLLVDYNNDGFLDISTAMAGGHLIENIGGVFTWKPGIFEAHTFQSEIQAFADFDNDGDLDVYRTGWETEPSGPYFPDAIFMFDGIFNKVWWQEIEGDWTDGIGDRRAGRGVTAADFDEDGDMDVYVSNYRLAPNYLWQNDGDGNFTDVATALGVDGDGSGLVYDWGHTIGSAWGDLDNDGHLDLVVGNFAHSTATQDRPKFYRNMGAAGGWQFEDKSASVGLPYVQSHASPALADYDNDGDLDIFIATVAGYYAGEKCTLLRNEGNWVFTDVSVAEGMDITTTTTNFAASWADYDNDGDLDLFTGRKLYENQVSNGNHWLKVKLAGFAGHVNYQAVGSQVRIQKGVETLTRQVETATGWGNQNDSVLHFGLGADASAVDLVVTWPNGDTTELDNVSVDQLVSIQYIPNTLTDATDDVVSYTDETFGEVQGWFATSQIDDPNFYGTTEIAPTTSLDAFAQGTSALFGDINGDGLADVVTLTAAANFDWTAAHSVGDGSGNGILDDTTISSVVGFGTVAGNRGNFLADVTGDGILDAVTLNPGFNWYCLPSGAAGIGTGTSLQGPAQWGLDNGIDIPLIGDFNGDDSADIMVWRSNASTFVKLSAGGVIGAGAMVAGSFGAPAWDSALIGDINGDGRDDLIAIDTNDGDGAANGTLSWIAALADATGKLDYATAHSNVAIFGLNGDTPYIADVNGDGFDDLVVKSQGSNGTAKWSAVLTLADGTIGSPTAATAQWVYGKFGDVSLFSDLDTSNDGDDLVSFRIGYPAGSWLGSRTRLGSAYLTGNIDTSTVLPITSQLFDPMLGDVDGDGADDLIVRVPTISDTDPNSKPQWIAYHSSVNSQGYAELGTSYSSSIPQFGGKVANLVEQFLGDVDGDGTDDAITVNSGFGWAACGSIAGIGFDASKSNQSTTQHGLAGDLPFVGDFNNDGLTDVGVYRQAGGNIFIKFTANGVLGDGGAGPVGQIGGAATDSVLVGDLNGDGFDDIVMVRQDGAGLIDYWGLLNDGTGLMTYGAGMSLTGFGLDGIDTPFLADINGDGMDDICIHRNSAVNEMLYTTFTTAGGVLGTNGAGDDFAAFGKGSGILLIGRLGVTCPAADLNGDCAVNSDDLDLFASDWLAGYELDDFAELALQWLIDCPGGVGCLE